MEPTGIEARGSTLLDPGKPPRTEIRPKPEADRWIQAKERFVFTIAPDQAIGHPLDEFQSQLRPMYLVLVRMSPASVLMKPARFAASAL